MVMYLVTVLGKAKLLPLCLQGTSFAGPCNEGGQMSAWWKVDLGEDQQVVILNIILS